MSQRCGHVMLVNGYLVLTCFDMCQLTITCMSNIKDVRYKPRLHASVSGQPISCSMAVMLRDVVFRRRRRAHARAMHTASVHGFLFLCMHVVLSL